MNHALSPSDLPAFIAEVDRHAAPARVTLDHYDAAYDVAHLRIALVDGRVALLQLNELQMWMLWAQGAPDAATALVQVAKTEAEEGG